MDDLENHMVVPESNPERGQEDCDEAYDRERQEKIDDSLFGLAKDLTRLTGQIAKQNKEQE